MVVVKTNGLDMTILKLGPFYWFYLGEFETPIVVVRAAEFRAFVGEPAEGKPVRSTRFTDITNAVLAVELGSVKVGLTFYTSNGEVARTVSCRKSDLLKALDELDLPIQLGRGMGDSEY